MKLLSFDQQCNETSIANGSENFELRNFVWIVFLLFGSCSSMGFLQPVHYRWSVASFSNGMESWIGELQ
jgi:hypothetical protein